MRVGAALALLAVLVLAVPRLFEPSTWMNLRSGDTIVWTRASREDGSVEVHVYVLNPGRLQRVTFDLATVPTTICNIHLEDWRIVAEHALG